MICLSQHPLFRIYSSKDFPILFCQCNIMTPKSRIGYRTPCKFPTWSGPFKIETIVFPPDLKFYGPEQKCL